MPTSHITRAGRSRRLLAPLALTAVTAIALAGCASGSSAETTATPDAELSELAAQLPQSILDKGKIDDLVQTPAAPFEFVDESTGELTGIDIDLTNRISEVIGFPIEITQVSDFANLIPGVQSGRADMVMSGTLDKLERQDVVDIVDYFTTGTVFMKLASNSDINGYEDLCGQTVVTASGTDYPSQTQAISEEYCGDPNSIQILTTSSGFGDYVNQLELGRAVALVNGSDFSAYEAAENYPDELEVVGDPVINPGVYGVLVNKDLPELRDVIQQALTIMIEDGSYQEILEKWGQGAAAVDEITINSATQ
ncbi:transporter substrate-binding domain-containing protein [Herbiconiux moechotypicola]|uniref:ABC transporter substrate-binding protein n=1 Tax=Herbiconiux moechotypicola TaxID=637393 RepID=A0ABP5Q789_9MICO|nr:transporter substrate-binding domain-containing protein [Herbiconiux moechotypicola]MCS5729140.1 transporter substrate-binding domain-containing protein [Herbiconiux moechotypicola]